MASIDLGANTGNSSGTGSGSGGGGGSSQWITSGNNIYYNVGNVGIETTNPLVPLQVYDSLASTSVLRSGDIAQVEEINFVATNSASGSKSVSVIRQQVLLTGSTSAVYDGLLIDTFVVDSNTATIGGMIGITNFMYAGGTGNIAPSGMTGFNNFARFNSSGTCQSITGISGQAQNFGAGTVSTLTGVSSFATNIGAGLVTSAVGFDNRLNLTGVGGTIIQAKCYRSVTNVSSGSSVNSAYGLFIETSGSGIGAVSSSFGIYQIDTRPNFFNGSIGIGVSSVTAQLHTTGTVRFASFGVGTATFDANGNLSSVSDEDLKDVQGPFSDSLEQLKLIKPIVYKWNEKSGLETENEYIGWSAQNLKAAITGAVYTKKMWAWDDDCLIRAVSPGETLPNTLDKMPQDLKDMAPELGFYIPNDKHGNPLPEHVPDNLPPVADYFKQKDIHSVNDRAILAAVVNALKAIDQRLLALEKK